MSVDLDVCVQRRAVSTFQEKLGINVKDIRAYLPDLSLRIRSLNTLPFLYSDLSVPRSVLLSIICEIANCRWRGRSSAHYIPPNQAKDSSNFPSRLSLPQPGLKEWTEASGYHRQSVLLETRPACLSCTQNSSECAHTRTHAHS